MHELSVAQSIFAAITAEAKKHNAKPISAKISCGILNAINDQLLIEAFNAISRGTSCENLKLGIEHKPMRGKCKICTKEFEIDFSTAECSGCGSENFELLPDAPLLLEQIELENENEN